MEFEKYRHVIKLLGDARNARPGMSDKDLTAMFEEIMGYVFANWVAPEHKDVAAIDALTVEFKDVLYGDRYKSIANLESIPPYYSEGAFPVAVACHLIRDLRMPPMVAKTVGIREYSDRYYHIIKTL